MTPDLIVLIPSSFAKYMPTIAVKRISETVFRAPISPPILIIKKISSAGTPINSKKNEFICLIQNYIINVYLSNYE